MRKPRILVMAAAGVAMSIMLCIPAMAADSNAVSYGEATAPAADTDTAVDGSAIPGDGSGHDLEGQSTIPYPTDIQLLEQGERNYIYKTYTVAANYDPDSLVEPTFSQGGYRYRFSEIIMRDSTPASSSKTVTEFKTVDSDTGDEATILSMLGNKLPYTDAEGYQGELFLIPESLNITQTGQTTYSYTVTETERYELPSNDMSQIPKSITKNGRTLSLQGVDWQVTGNDGEGYSGVPSSYTAVATYSVPATGSKASGYTATASYSGEVVRQLIGKSTYTIVYEGEQIVIPYNFVPLLIAGAIVVCGIVSCIILWTMRRNVTIYEIIDGVPEQYGKVRLNRKKPVLDLSRLTSEVRLVLDKRFIKTLYDGSIFVVGPYQNHRIYVKGEVVEIPAQEPPANYTGKGRKAPQPVSQEVET